MVVLPLLSLLIGCDAVEGLLSSGPGPVAEAQAALSEGRLADARQGYTLALQSDPGDVDAAVGLAYLQLLAGENGAADATLAAVLPAASARAGEVELRRALVALETGDLDGVKAHGLASGRAAGRLLAGEVELADGDRDAARADFDVAKDDPGGVGALAARYLEVLSDPNPRVVGLAETQALWALGRRQTAVRSVEDLVLAYAETHDDGAEQILLWAGRAAAIGEAEVATSLLDALTVPPPGQSWRVAATRAIVRCAEGDGPGCRAALLAVQPLAPEEGYEDAVVTAATALSASDVGAARTLVQAVGGDASARLLASLGDRAAALRMVEDPVLRGAL